jgi:hypothetical protein
MIICLAFLSSCGKSVPKCNDPQVIATVKEIILDNFEDKMKESLGGLAELSGEDNSQKNKNLTQNEIDAEIEREKAKAKRKSETDISNIITIEVDEKLKSCGCEGTFKDSEVGLFAGIPFEGIIIKNGDQINYTVKTDSEDNIVVEVIIY